MKSWFACGIICALDVAAAALYQNGFGPFSILLIMYVVANLIAAAIGCGFVISHLASDALRARRNVKVLADTFPPGDSDALNG